MYVYLHADKTTDDLPPELLARVKPLTHVMDLALDTGRKLARVDVNKVMRALEEKGYFLQMPPDSIHTAMHYGD